MVDRCLSVDGLGYQVFNVSNDSHSVDRTTAQLIEEFYPNVPVKREMGERETFYANDKAKAMLGFSPQYDWRDYIGT
jgi:nucleoside-diphosphate-sugar epimerase